MIDNKKLVIIVTAMAIVGVLGLLAYSTNLGPVGLDIGEIGLAQDGVLVITHGTITGARALSDGGISLMLSDMNTSKSIGVYILPDAGKSWAGGNLVPGAMIEVRGLVSTYLEAPEITVESACDITMLMAAGNSEYELATIMRSIRLFDGMEVTTSGEIAEMRAIVSGGNLTGTSFRLRQQADDQTYYLECVCFGRDLTATNEERESVCVTGVISYYENNGYWQMVVEMVSPVP